MDFCSSDQIRGYFETEKELEPVINTVINCWKQKTTKYFYPELKNVHDCKIDKTKCNMYQVKFDIYLSNKGTTRCNVLLDEFKTSGMYVDPKEWNLIKTVDCLYVCLRSGEPHLCGNFCNEMEPVGKDHMYVCMHTGMSKGEVEYKNPLEYLPAQSTEEKRLFRHVLNPLYQNNKELLEKFLNKRKYNQVKMMEEGPAIYDLEQAIYNPDSLSSNIFDRSNVVSNLRKNDMSLKQHWLINTYAVLLKQFSFERFNLEEKESQSQDSLTRREAERYFTRCESNNIAPDILYMWQLMRWKRLELYTVPRVELDSKSRSQLALHYATKCIKFYAIVRTKTLLGKENPNRFPYKTFIVAALNIFESGLNIKIKNKGQIVTVIERDPMLAAFSLGNHINTEQKGYRISHTNLTKINSKLQKKKDFSKIDDSYTTTKTTPCESQNKKENKIKPEKKLGKKGKNYSKVRTAIEEAISQSLNEKRTSPEELKIESIDYDMISEEIFVSYNQKNFAKKKKM